MTHVKTKKCSRTGQFYETIHPPEWERHTHACTHIHTHTFFSILLLFVCLSFTIIAGQRNPSLWHWYEQQFFCSSKKRHLVTRGCLSSTHNVGFMWCFRALFTFENNPTGLTNCQRRDRKRERVIGQNVSALLTSSFLFLLTSVLHVPLHLALLFSFFPITHYWLSECGMYINQCQGSSSRVDWLSVDCPAVCVCSVSGEDAGRETVITGAQIDGVQ